MNTTTNLLLKTYNDSDNPSFLEYRKSINDDVNSNMTKIDDFAGDITDTVNTHKNDTTIHVTSTEKTTWNNKVDSSRVLTNVPAGAVFTDTVTTINGKTGIIVKDDITALGIPSQDTVTSVNGKTGTITRDDIIALGIPSQDTITSVNGTTGIILKEDIVALGIPAQDTDTITTINGKTGIILKEDIVALGIPAQDTIYTHPVSHPASIITTDNTRLFVTQTQIDAWDAKETTSGAQTKANTALASANTYTDTKVAGISGGADATYKFIVPRYQENLQLASYVDWNVKVPYSTGGYMPKKVVIYSREARNLDQQGNLTTNLYFEIVKETDGSFTMTANAFAICNSVASGLAVSVITNAQSNSAVFSYAGGTYGYGEMNFLSSVTTAYWVEVGYFSYDATGLSFIINCSHAQFTSIDFYGFVY